MERAGPRGSRWTGCVVPRGLRRPAPSWLRARPEIQSCRFISRPRPTGGFAAGTARRFPSRSARWRWLSVSRWMCRRRRRRSTRTVKTGTEHRSDCLRIALWRSSTIRTIRTPERFERFERPNDSNDLGKRASARRVVMPVGRDPHTGRPAAPIARHRCHPGGERRDHRSSHHNHQHLGLTVAGRLDAVARLNFLPLPHEQRSLRPVLAMRHLVRGELYRSVPPSSKDDINWPARGALGSSNQFCTSTISEGLMASRGSCWTISSREPSTARS